MAGMTGLQQKLESVSGRFSCGDLIFDDENPLSKVIVQKQNITCETPIEKGYYSVPGRSLKVKNVCIHCGAGGSKEFILDNDSLKKRHLTGGKECFPICIECLNGGKKVEKKKGKKDTQQERKEKEHWAGIAKAKKNKKTN